VVLEEREDQVDAGICRNRRPTQRTLSGLLSFFPFLPSCTDGFLLKGLATSRPTLLTPSSGSSSRPVRFLLLEVSSPVSEEKIST
jgi:hypothetical protein